MSDVTYPPNATQQLVDIDDIKDGVVYLKNGSVRAIIMVSGINFELKSEQEQDAIVGAYQSFLNALDFSLQLIIHSRKLNIQNYLDKMVAVQQRESNELLKNQASEYIEFIKGFVKKNDIMTKNFFAIVPYDGNGVKEIQRGISRFIPFLKKKKQTVDESREQKVGQLRQRIDEVVGGIEQIGLRAIQLNDDEILELYYNLYNPQDVSKDLSSKQSPTTS